MYIVLHYLLYHNVGCSTVSIITHTKITLTSMPCVFTFSDLEVKVKWGGEYITLIVYLTIQLDSPFLGEACVHIKTGSYHSYCQNKLFQAMYI